jgi:hypothetical protein
MKKPLHFSLRLMLLVVALCAVSFAWLKARRDHVWAEHEGTVVNLRTRLGYVEDFRSELNEQLARSKPQEQELIREKLSEYDDEREDLLRRIEWR